MPTTEAGVNEKFDTLKNEPNPDLIFTHHQRALHQDHRTIAELTWNTFRDHFILEYEIPKFDSDLGSPNFFVPIDAATATQKARAIVEGFPSQRSKRWFSEDTFLALMRLRGVQSAASHGYSEAFYAQ